MLHLTGFTNFMELKIGINNFEKTIDKTNIWYII